MSTMASKSSPHVLILGSGIGGLTLAQTLRKKGISYEVFERDASDHARPEGWSIGIHSMIDDLKASLPDDLSPIEELSHLRALNLPAEMVYYAYPDFPKIGVRDDGSGRILRIGRWRLRDWLATNLPIQHGKHAVRVEEGKDSVTVHFSDGTSATGDILVGADGARSITRRHIFPEGDALQVENTLIISGDVTLDQQEMERELSRGYSGYVVSSEDVDGVYYTLFIGMNEVLPDRKSGRYYFHLQQRRAGVDKEDFWAFKASAEQLLDEARRITAALPARFKTILDKATPEGIRVPPLRMYCLLLDSLPESRITLLGDAAHAMPARSHAIRDGLNLARAIAEMDMNDEQAWKKSIGEYQKEMVARGSNAARLSHEAFDPKTSRSEGGPRYIWGEPVHPLPEETITL